MHLFYTSPRTGPGRLTVLSQTDDRWYDLVQDYSSPTDQSVHELPLTSAQRMSFESYYCSLSCVCVCVPVCASAAGVSY